MQTTGSISLKLVGTAVYRIYNWRGDLLYVGITDSICQRMTNHLQTAAWAGQASRVEWEEHPTRSAAELEEWRQIRDLKPRFNVNKRGRLRSRRAPTVEFTRGWRVILTPDDTHEDGCPEGARLAHRRLSPGDRF